MVARVRGTESTRVHGTIPMISQIKIANFKSWRSTGEVRLAPITVFFGSNSSGKTSLLQALLMMKQTVESPDRAQTLNLGGDDRSLVDLGTFQDIAFGHDDSLELDFGVRWNLPGTFVAENSSDPTNPLFKANELGFDACVKWLSSEKGKLGRIVSRSMAYEAGGHRFSMVPKENEYSEFDLISESDGVEFKRTRGRAWPLPHPAKCYGFPDQVRAYFQNAGFLSDLELEFEQLFSRVFYLGPLREHPRRQYAWSGARPTDMGRRGERVIEALLASRESGHRYSKGRGHKRRTLEELVADQLKVLGLIDSFRVKPITDGGKLFQVRVKRQPGSAEVLLTDVGFGVSQILPVVTLCHYAPEGSTILLEQPEIHLHPSVQAGLADVIIEAAKSRSVQIIVESHSEHLLRRIQRNIAEEKIENKDTALYFCGMDRGASRLTSLSVDVFGTIENWPAEFFGDEFGEIAATQRAAAKRKAKIN